MAEVARSHARGRWARPLALCALAPVLAHAQSAVCTTAAPWRLPSQVYVAPIAVRALGRSLLIVGDPAYRFATDADGAPIVADSMLAGLRTTPGDSVISIGRPASSRAFVQPRIVPRTETSTDVVWSEPDFLDGGRPSAGPHRLHVGTLTNGRWSGLQFLGRFELNTLLTREVGSDLVTVGGVTYMAFPDEVFRTAERRIVLLSDSGGRWATTVLRFDLATTGATELGDDSGVLTAIFLGQPQERPVDRLSRTSTVWLARRTPDGWTRAVQIGGDEVATIQYPKLVRHGSSLIAAWLSSTGEPALEWREVTHGAAPGPLRRLEGISSITQGQAPFRDLLSLRSTDGTSRVVQLRRDGYDRIFDVPSGAQIEPVVVGTRERPWALAIELLEPPAPGPYRLVAHDLHCALRR